MISMTLGSSANQSNSTSADCPSLTCSAKRSFTVAVKGESSERGVCFPLWRAPPKNQSLAGQFVPDIAPRDLYKETAGCFLFLADLCIFNVTLYLSSGVVNHGLAEADNHDLSLNFPADINATLVLTPTAVRAANTSRPEPSRIKPYGAVSFTGSVSQLSISATHSDGLHTWPKWTGLWYVEAHRQHWFKEPPRLARILCSVFSGHGLGSHSSSHSDESLKAHPSLWFGSSIIISLRATP